MKYFYFGHHKAATKFIDNKVMDTVCQELMLTHKSYNSAELFNYDLEKKVVDDDIDYTGFVNSDYKFVETMILKFRGFHVIRDPRDILVSAYFSHLKSHEADTWKELDAHRSKLKGLSQEEGLLLELKFLVDLPTNGENVQPIQSMLAWNYEDKNILETNYEKLSENEEEFFVEVLKHLGLLKKGDKYIDKYFEPVFGRKISREKLKSIISKHSFRNISGGRKKGSEDSSSHYRKGQPGDWKNYFDKKLTREFKKAFPGAISKLGYEKDENW